MAILLSDPRVRHIPVDDNREPLQTLGPEFGVAGAKVRAALAIRLRRARTLLPAGLGLRIVEGYRSLAAQRRIIQQYTQELRVAYPHLSSREMLRLRSRFVSPIAVAPHVSGAAVDVTLADADGNDLDMGTAIDATPEQSGNRCYFDASDISDAARSNRTILAETLTAAGLVNYPTEWWHWSYGDRYWALLTGAPAALYGSVHSPGCSETA